MFSVYTMKKWRSRFSRLRQKKQNRYLHDSLFHGVAGLETKVVETCKLAGRGWILGKWGRLLLSGQQLKSFISEI